MAKKKVTKLYTLDSKRNLSNSSAHPDCIIESKAIKAMQTAG
jgi:hypothetical protein